MTSRLVRAVALTVVATAMSGCFGPGPFDASAVFRPSSMAADRETISAGGPVRLTFPDGLLRTSRYVLEEEVGSSWVYRYQMTSTAETGRSTWTEAGDDSLEVAAGDVFGPGPDTVVIPEVASPGSWRICTTGPEESVCVRIEIVEG